jgi:cellulose/xylan binding protein with CBM9 domain
MSEGDRLANLMQRIPQTREPSKVVAAHHTTVDLAGQLDRPEWQQAPPVSIVSYWSGKQAPAGRHAEARILWSSKALHVRFVCPQTEPLVVSANPQTAKKAMGLWDRDACEIFIAPDVSVVERYFEFEAAPNGEWLDVAIQWGPDKRESDWKFNSHMTTAARIERDRVIIAIRIPWNHWLPEPQKGERWRVNLFRCVGSDPDRGYLAWQPTRTPEPNFHVPQAFGWLVFK